jgi:cell wall-associated NlpC family hydrolase
MSKKGLQALILLAAVLVMWGCGTPQKVRLYESGSSAASAPSVPKVREDIVQTAISLHGSPYRNGAKGSDAFDCSGFVHYVYKRSGITLPVSTDKLVKAGTEIPGDQVQPGDLVFFKIKKDLHVGIMINRKEFIHASKSRGIALDDIEAKYWKRSHLSFRCVIS